MNNKIKIGIIGNGNICNLAHIPAWKSIKEAEVVANCDVIEEKAKKVCTELGTKKYYTDANDMLLDDSIDIIDICLPTNLHAEYAIKSLKAGKNVICEKPISNNLQDAEKMIATAKETNKKLFIGHTRRFDPRWIKIKETINSGKIGTPIYIRRCERGFSPFTMDSWYWDYKKSGGALLSIGIHCSDFARWYMESEAIEVFAKGKTIRKEAKEKKCYDLAIIMIQFEGNKTAVIEASWAHPKEYATFHTQLDIIGTSGKIEYSNKATNPMIIVGKHIEYPQYSPVKSSMLESFAYEIQHFLDCIKSNKEPKISLEDAYIALKIIKAAEKSIQTNKPVKVR